MPHRIVIAGLGKLAMGVSGALASLVAAFSLDPDHAKAMVLAIGGGCLLLIYTAMRDLVPAYVNARKALRQMSVDLAEIDRKVSHASTRQDETDSRIELNSRAIEAAKAEAVAKALEVERRASEKALELERKASEKRHALAEQVQRDLAQRQLDLLAAHDRIAEQDARIAELERKLGSTATTHAQAINTVVDDVHTIADHMDHPVAVGATHLDPTPPSSRDDIEPVSAPSPIRP